MFSGRTRVWRPGSAPLKQFLVIAGVENAKLGTGGSEAGDADQENVLY